LVPPKAITVTPGTSCSVTAAAPERKKLRRFSSTFPPQELLQGVDLDFNEGSFIR
jgi:hypothetical protein